MGKKFDTECFKSSRVISLFLTRPDTILRALTILYQKHAMIRFSAPWTKLHFDVLCSYFTIGSIDGSWTAGYVDVDAKPTYITTCR